MFTESDIKSLLRTHPSATPPCTELLSGSGIVTESALRAEISTRILTSPGRTSVFELARELSVETRAIERLLPAKQSGWVRIGGSVIITACELRRLRDKVQVQLESGLVNVPGFCRDNAVDIEVFRRLPGETYHWLGNDREWVFAEGFLEKVRGVVLDLLGGVNGPVEIFSLLSKGEFPIAFVSAVVTPMTKDGVLDGIVKDGYYIPNIYIRAQQDGLVEELRHEGILELQSLQKAGVQDPRMFISERVFDSQLLTTHFVTREFVEDVRRQISVNISKQMWTDLTFLDTRLSPADTSALINLLTTPDGSPLEEIGPFAVSTSLLPSLTSTSEEYAKSLAEKVHAKGAPPNPNLTPQDLSKHLSSRAPKQVLTRHIPTLHPPALALFTSHFESLKSTEITDARQTFSEKHYTRLVVHKRAIDGLGDKSLRPRLEADLLAHCRSVVIPSLNEHTNSTPGVSELCKNLIEARDLGSVFGHLSAFVGDMSPDADAMLAAKTTMVRELTAQLRECNDPGVMVVLACLAALGGKGHGVVKFSEEYVPVFVPKKQKRKGVGEEGVAERLVREARRKKVVEGVLEILERVLNGVLKKVKIEEGDLERLRGVGSEA